MPKEIQTNLGVITVSEDVIATVAGMAAMECYGLVGMVSRKQVKDTVTEWFGRENPGRGVEVRIQNDQIIIDLHIIVSYGVRISEVAQNVMDSVKYTFDQTLGLKVDQVNIIVQGVKVQEDRA